MDPWVQITVGKIHQYIDKDNYNGSNQDHRAYDGVVP